MYYQQELHQLVRLCEAWRDYGVLFARNINHWLCRSVSSFRWKITALMVVRGYRDNNEGRYARVTLYTAGHLHTAVPHCWYSRAPIVHTAVPPLFTQPCPGEQWARLCVFTLQGCVQAARLCRWPVVMYKGQNTGTYLTQRKHINNME